MNAVVLGRNFAKPQAAMVKNENMTTSQQLRSLTAQQQTAVHLAACQFVSAAVKDETPKLTDSLMGGAAGFPCSGLFVTLKCDGKLRGCYGTYGNVAPLNVALPKAAHSASTSDPRFSPVTIGELDSLHLEVSLLHSLQLITDRGDDRIAQIEVGRHGLEITVTDRRGLLLPRVAVDFGLDALGFLQQVCKKADLPQQAWQQSDAKLTRFEAYCFGGPFSA